MCCLSLYLFSLVGCELTWSTLQPLQFITSSARASVDVSHKLMNCFVTKFYPFRKKSWIAFLYCVGLVGHKSSFVVIKSVYRVQSCVFLKPLWITCYFLLLDFRILFFRPKLIGTVMLDH